MSYLNHRVHKLKWLYHVLFVDVLLFQVFQKFSAKASLLKYLLSDSLGWQGFK